MMFSLLKTHFDRFVAKQEQRKAFRTDCCLYCKSRKSGPNPLHLCPLCDHNIPWVHHIVCQTCGRNEKCIDCQRGNAVYFKQNRSVVSYDHTMKNWLARYKYRGDERLKFLFAKMLYQTFRNDYYNQGNRIDLIVFVPLSEERKNERGFNQSKQMADELSLLTGIPVVPLLKRERHTEKQSKKTRKERLDNLFDAFSVDLIILQTIRKKYTQKLIKILIVDDVYTTGSTLNECARTIRTYLESEIYGLTWARS